MFRRQNKYMTIDEAAQHLKVHKTRISQLIGSKQFKRFVKRGRVYILREEVEEYDEITQSV